MQLPGRQRDGQLEAYQSLIYYLERYATVMIAFRKCSPAGS